uniref:Uncharacterized protein n=1 Tax=Arundo donax TaxID=35708 RepID=A0A0A9BDD9_ARUDO
MLVLEFFTFIPWMLRFRLMSLKKVSRVFLLGKITMNSSLMISLTWQSHLASIKLFISSSTLFSEVSPSRILRVLVARSDFCFSPGILMP